MKKSIKILLWLILIMLVYNIAFNVYFWIIAPNNYAQHHGANFVLFLAHQEILLIFVALPMLILNIILTIFLIPLCTKKFKFDHIYTKILFRILIFTLSIVTFGIFWIIIIIFLLKKMK